MSAKGRVNSILLFLKKPLEEVLKGRIALTATSATSVILLKILMKMYYKADPSYVTMEPSLDEMLEEADAALLIGDSAIHASWANQERGLTVIDLGELWRSWTGYGMTFALVAVRKEIAQADPGAVSEVLEAMTTSKERSLRDLEPLVAKACAQLGGEASYWTRILTSCTIISDRTSRRDLCCISIMRISWACCRMKYSCNFLQTILPLR